MVVFLTVLPFQIIVLQNENGCDDTNRQSDSVITQYQQRMKPKRLAQLLGISISLVARFKGVSRCLKNKTNVNAMQILLPFPIVDY